MQVPDVLDLADRLCDLTRTGGKGAALAALSRVDGAGVPPGFVVTTDAFGRLLAGLPDIEELLLDALGAATGSQALAQLPTSIDRLSAELRALIETAGVPPDTSTAIGRALERLGPGPCAVRSSATAEDLPGASFAGQHDSYLGVVGLRSVLDHVSRCWASLFTERAIAYRVHHGIDQRTVRMAVVVQRMIDADAAGVLFTADPMTSNRQVTRVDTVRGLGEALVAGHAAADSYTVRDGRILTRSIERKPWALRLTDSGGTVERPVPPDQVAAPSLTDAQVLRLVELGRHVETRFGAPQDIEWCLADNDFHLVQARPITTLFPIPPAPDSGPRVYVSVGHQQMMTDAMKPLGLSFWQLTTPAPMAVAGSRLFVDVTAMLTDPARRASLLEVFGQGDPQVRNALETVLDRGFLPASPADDERGSTADRPVAQPRPPGTETSDTDNLGVDPADTSPADTDPAGTDPADTSPAGTNSADTDLPDVDPAVIADLIAETRASLSRLEQEIATKSGPALIAFIREDLAELRRLLFDPRSRPLIAAAMDAPRWLNGHLHVWLGEDNVADTLTLSVPDNITSEMGLALLDVADALRPHPEVVTALRGQLTEGFGDQLLLRVTELPGGPEVAEAVRGFLAQYGMRCPGEIDLTRPRWSERPTMLVPALLAHLDQFEAGERARRFERGRLAAAAKERELLDRLRALPDGADKVRRARHHIDLLRRTTGYREFPKFGMIARYFVYKRALLAEAERLTAAGVLTAPDDIFFLWLDELEDVVRTGPVDHSLIGRRRAEFAAHENLRPPRVLTSEGECLHGSLARDDVPAGALVGLPVCAGTVEGRARVVHDPSTADLQPGDILVTAGTDPAWSPLFVTASGLVTEVGGLMTHGAVIAREYGLPAVVGVHDATRLIADGQRIRVHGTDGYVELLD